MHKGSDEPHEATGEDDVEELKRHGAIPLGVLTQHVDLGFTGSICRMKLLDV